MLRCKRCETEFSPDRAIRRTEYFEFDGNPVREQWLACPECGDTDLEQGWRCPLCGAFARRGLCTTCAAHVKNCLTSLVGISRNEVGKEAILDEITAFLEENSYA